jgi:hypothetical protein
MDEPKTTEQKFNELFSVDENQELKETAIEIVETTTELTKTIESDNSDLINDYDKVRDKLGKVIDIGVDAVEELSMVAQENAHPNCYEALASLIKSVTDANTQLIEIHSKIKGIRGGSVELNQKNITNNNNLFVSTKDLQKMVREQQENIKRVDNLANAREN